MSGWINYLYSFIGGGGLVLSITGLWLICLLPGIDRWSRRFFQIYFAILIGCCFTGVMELVIQMNPPLIRAIYPTLMLESLLISLPMVMMTVYLLHCCKERLRGNGLLRTVLGLWIIYCILLVVSGFIKGFIQIAPDGQYDRGLWYPLLVLPITVILLLDIYTLIRCRKQLSRKTFRSFLIAIIPVTAAITVQMFVEIYPLIDICMVVSSVAIYSVVLSDQIEQDLQHQREIATQQLEIANQRASIMVLQMRPHFIYNTMTSVYCLCNQDPGLARQVIMDFTTYLRKNFTAIASTAPIPFTSELEHTKAYLAVEKAQYEDSLFVDYDTPHTWFRVPPLTLQPIVENAVKHGRDPYAGPFYISIRTRKTDQGSEIVVSDNGKGFAPDDDDEPHIALQNICQRLEIMCGGKLSITSEESGGTVVTVTIPDMPENPENDQ